VTKSFLLVALAAAILPAQAQAADAAAGKAVFGSFCAACHSVDKPAQNKMGPSLLGVVGRKAGTIAGFNYSKPMKSYGQKWTPAALDLYLTDPKKVVPGTLMTFRGLSNPEARANLIAYLASAN